MKALFQLAADCSIEVEKGPERTVYFRVIEGVDYEKSRNPFTAIPEGSPLKQTLCIPLHEREARALGSALMGCAAGA